MGAVLAALALIALGAIAGVVIATAISLRSLPDKLFAAALPDDLLDQYLESIRDTWQGFAAQKIVSISRSRVLALIWKGSWAPIVTIGLTLCVLGGAVWGIDYCELLSLPYGLAFSAIPALQFGLIAFVLEWLAIGLLSKGIGKLRTLAVDQVAQRFQKAAPKNTA